MKKHKYNGHAARMVLLSAIILFTAAFTGCGSETSYSNESDNAVEYSVNSSNENDYAAGYNISSGSAYNENYTTNITGDYVPGYNLQAIQFHANRYIEYLSEELWVGIFEYGDRDNHTYIRPANILEARINTLEKEAEFDDIMGYNIELWRLDFMLLTDDFESETLRWGTFTHDDDGWVGHHTAWNDARTLLVFSTNENEVTLLGSINWWMESMSYSLERAAQGFMAGINLIPSPLPARNPPFATKEWDGQFLVHGLDIFITYSPESGFFFSGMGFPADVLEYEDIEGTAVVTQDSLRVQFVVARNEIILPLVDGPMGTRTGPWVEFEHLPEIGVISMIHHPFEFQSDHESLYFDLTEEDAAAIAQFLRQALVLISYYVNSAF